MKVRAVVFDLFNTLTAPVDDVDFRASVRAMGWAAGVDPDAFTRGWFDVWRQQLDGTLGTSEAGVRRVCEAMGAEVAQARIGRAVEVRLEFSRQALRPRGDAVATLRHVRRMGVRTALLSNCTADVPDLWPSLPYAELIDEPLFSCAEGLVKPHPGLYQRACERLGVGPAACIYVGDGDDHELTGAARAGMRAVLIRTPEETAASSLSERGSWRGEAIDTLSEIPGLIRTGSAA
ncbi:MAG: HAD-IA family hydrolase [Chloroflexota bacterium]|nr:HAD-IA family hydrolase [Chloroflexota bacterium]